MAERMFVFRILIVAMMINQVAALPTMATEKLQANDTAIDALGEFLRGMNTLAGGSKALPGGTPFLEKVRTKYEIPERIQIFSPRGGEEIIAMIFNNERLPVVGGKWSEITPEEYKYLQSNHNLKAVYCLYEKEPLDIGDVVIAVQHEDAGTLLIYFNDKRGAVGSARICSGNSILFSNSQYIVRFMAQGQ